MARLQHVTIPNAAMSARVLTQHTAIIAALAARDADGAEAAMRTHLRSAYANVERLMTDMPAYFEHEAEG